MNRTRSLLLAGAIAASGLAAGSALSQDEAKGPAPAPEPPKDSFKGADPREHSPADMNRRMVESMTPNRFHKRLERLLGEWDLELRMWMDRGSPPMTSKGTSSWTWMFEGKWIQGSTEFSMMGMKMQMRTILGYDNFKKKFVSCTVNSMETAMRHAEGNFGMDDSVLYTYGPVDEYMTGEHAKTSAFVYRFDGPDRFTIEVHDLSIGLENAKVMEFVHTRRK
jgi:hypothetical protein